MYWFYYDVSKLSTKKKKKKEEVSIYKLMFCLSFERKFQYIEDN